MGNTRGVYPRVEQRPQPEFLSHETVCILNACDEDAHIEIMVFFSDREPAVPTGLP